MRAHPRVCGENKQLSIDVWRDNGSSPRVRGKHTPPIVVVCGEGLIPACAGKTVAIKAAQSATTAHPRVCGENSQLGIGRVMLWGSSPRVRGKLESARA